MVASGFFRRNARIAGVVQSVHPQGVAYDRYRTGREASFDLLIHIAPDVVKMLTPEQKRLIPQFVANYLDVKYLRQNRSSSVGGGF